MALTSKFESRKVPSELMDTRLEINLHQNLIKLLLTKRFVAIHLTTAEIKSKEGYSLNQPRKGIETLT
ncbi:hypothetical protein DSBG_3458 [Desulfosporosinus sp. BG]|nr:hypothetical protein DSBG_3458 [Desulfosporosinus sp. BG]